MYTQLNTQLNTVNCVWLNTSDSAEKSTLYTETQLNCLKRKRKNKKNY